MQRDKEYIKLIIGRVLGVFLVTFILIVIIAGINIYQNQDENKEEKKEDKIQSVSENINSKEEETLKTKKKLDKNKKKTEKKKEETNQKKEENKTTFNVTEKPFEPCNEEVYTTEDGINVRNEEGEKVKQLLKGAKVIRVGYNEDWSEVLLNDKKYYMASRYLTTNNPLSTSLE